MNAQRCAVLEFKAGSGISQADVDGISAIFITYFRPAGYTMVERTQIDKAIDEQGFQRSRLTESNAVRIGQILNVSKIVVGDVNVVLGQYNVDARVINVESGTIAARAGESFTSSSYRSTMQSIAEELASQIAITSGGTVSSSKSQKRDEPYIIYGYLKVFPNDLGSYNEEPKQIINRLNQSQQYGYGTWRLPTNEELQLMRANNIIGNGSYMTRENKKGIVHLVTDKKKGVVASKVPEGFVDLGLPSGVLWREENEPDLYGYIAREKFGDKLPTKAQWEELKNLCEWNWVGDGYKVIGPNGEFIKLPADGQYNLTGKQGYGKNGWYWTAKEDYSEYPWMMMFSTYEIQIQRTSQKVGPWEYFSARLVKNSEYIDLGLPSGTKWKKENEQSEYWTYNKAVQMYGKQLPTQEQWEELKTKCRWNWDGNGYTIEGPNGNSITLPAEGFCNSDGSVNYVGQFGQYWSSTPINSEYAWCFCFKSGDKAISNSRCCIGLSVRLVR